MENEKGIVKLTRKQLYDEIWAVSVAGVARKYNLNYGKLIATCKVENIPFPSSGYWTKKNMGKDVSNEIVEFSGLEDTEISLITKDAVVKRIRKAKAEVVEKVHTDVTEELDVVTEEDLPQKKTDNIPEWPDGILDYLDETERNKVLEYACNLQISQSTRLHKMLVQYKKDIADYKSKLKEVQSRPYYNSRHNKPENEPEFFKEMSDECMSRAIAILDTVFKTIAWLSSKFTRNQIITVATIITVIGYMLFMSVGYILPKSIVLLNIIGFLIFFSQGAFNMTMIVMLNNTIEYDEVRFHERHDSIISAVRSFATKLVSVVDQAVVALILIISNIYAISQKISGLEIKAGIGELTSENVIVQADKFIQTADAGQRFILRLGIVAVPVISIGAAYILIKRKYIIDERKYEELVEEIKSTNKK